MDLLAVGGNHEEEGVGVKLFVAVDGCLELQVENALREALVASLVQGGESIVQRVVVEAFCGASSQKGQLVSDYQIITLERREQLGQL